MPTLLHNAARPTLQEPHLNLSAWSEEEAAPPIGVPLSCGQQRLWFLDKLEPNSPLYNVALAVRLHGRLNREVLQAALDEVLARHEALRTNFVGEHGTPLQFIREDAVLVLRSFDLSHEVEPELKLIQLLSQEAQKTFNLAEDLLIRAILWQLSATDQVLLLVLHHIICDEWSLHVLFRELTELYRSMVLGLPSPLAELPVQYGDFALWQREWLQGPAFAKQLHYWKTRLAGDVPRLNLPTDLPDPSSLAQTGARISAPISTALAEKVRHLTRGEGATLFMTLLSAFKLLLHRYSGQEQITVGSPIAGRNRLEIEDLIGFFVNTLVLRTSLSGDPTFRELLRRVRDTTIGAYEHQDLPFDKLVEELHPQRAPNEIPLIPVTFALEQDDTASLQLSDLELTWMEVESTTAKFDLTWTVRERGRALDVWVEYKTARFERSSIERMLGHWQMLLEGIAANPDLRLSQYGILTPAEQQQALFEWNPAPTPTAPFRSIAAIFEAQAERRPEALALRYGQTELSYAELNGRANQLARLLRGLKVGPDILVGLCADHSIDMIVAMLGIIKAGGTYVPLDPSYPKERLDCMLTDCQASVLVTQARWRERLPGTRAKIVCMDSLSSAPCPNPVVAVAPEHGAYVIYTSGSTGRPKGVMVPQRAITGLVLETDYVQLGPEDRVAQASNCCFDAATFEIWGALLNGAALIGVQRDILLTPRDFVKVLAAERITTLFLTTALFHQLAIEVPGAFRSIKHLLFGGEIADPKWVRQVLADDPPQRLLHVYGPTETTTFASWFLVKDVPAHARTIPIGRPIAHARLYILDRSMSPVPVGVAGELYVGGSGVARGYLHPDAATEAKFLPDSFSSEPGARLYRTGDLARYRTDGTVEFIGRLDGQVKIRGFRIELGEVEAALAAHPGVREAVVVANETEPGSGKRLVAYIVSKGVDKTSTSSELRRFLQERLPSHMIPSSLVMVDHLPLNANGKVDRKALPSLEPARTDLDGTFAHPLTVLEQKLALLWAEILGVERVGLTDNFFEMGGHSLLAVRLFGEIERRFGKVLPLASLFRSPTLGQLADLIQKQPAASSSPLITEIQPRGSKPPVFWMHSLGGDGGGAFFYYRRLAELLGPDQPSFGIHSPPEPFTRIEEMAAHYIDELLRFQPNGPYFLGGFCFGGVVAFEMARQMRQRGCDVGLLVLLESAPSNQGKSRWNLRKATAFLRNLPPWIGELLDQPPSDLCRRVQRKAVAQLNKVKLGFGSSAQASTAAGLADLIDLAEYPLGYVRFAQAHWQALRCYAPQPYSGRITLFRARKQPLLCVDPTLGWQSLAQEGVAVNVIPGTHENMLEEPNVQILAAELKACLAEAQRVQPEEDQMEGDHHEVEVRRNSLAAWPFSIIT